MTKKEDLDKLLSTAIPDAKYTITNNDNKDTFFYTIDKNLWQDYDLNYNVKLEDSSEFTMPVSVKDIESKGWQFKNSDAKEKILSPSSYQTATEFVNSKGNKIALNIYNGTDKDTAVKDCNVTGIELNIYSMYFSPEFHYEKNDDATSFTICDNLTDKSTMEDVIKRLGAPYKIRLITRNDNEGNYRNTEVTLTYMQKSNPKEQIIFVFSGDENRLLSLFYRQRS